MSNSNHPTRRGVLGTGAALTVLHGSRALAQTSARDAPAPAAVEVSFMVNGGRHQFELDPRTTLLDALRDHVGLIGTKKGCDHGQCGACTVLMDGVRRNACLNLAVACADREIVTIEG